MCVCVDGVCLTCQTYLGSLWISTLGSKYAQYIAAGNKFHSKWVERNDPACTGSYIPYVFSGQRQKKPEKTEQTKWKSASFGMMTVSRPQHALTRFNAQWSCMECSDVYKSDAYSMLSVINVMRKVFFFR